MFSIKLHGVIKKQSFCLGPKGAQWGFLAMVAERGFLIMVALRLLVAFESNKLQQLRLLQEHGAWPLHFFGQQWTGNKGEC